MKDTIDAVISALKDANTLSYISDQDIFTTENEYLIPETVKSHFISVKDGRESRRELSGGMIERTRYVKVSIYVQLAKPGAALMGDSASGKKGILEMADDVDTVLDENPLDISGIQSAFCRDIAESEAIGDDTGDVFIKKTMLYEYIKEEERP